MPTRNYKTYQIASPITTHYRKATCVEIDCPHYTNGWRIKLDILQPADKQAIKDSRRKYKVEDMPDGKWLIFEPGQPCFQASTHRIAVGRPEIYRVGRGDFRSYNPREARVLRADQWLDDFYNHQDKLKTLQERG